MILAPLACVDVGLWGSHTFIQEGVITCNWISRFTLRIWTLFVLIASNYPADDVVVGTDVQLSSLHVAFPSWFKHCAEK